MYYMYWLVQLIRMLVGSESCMLKLDMTKLIVTLHRLAPRNLRHFFIGNHEVLCRGKDRQLSKAKPWKENAKERRDMTAGKGCGLSRKGLLVVHCKLILFMFLYEFANSVTVAAVTSISVHASCFSHCRQTPHMSPGPLSPSVSSLSSSHSSSM